MAAATFVAGTAVAQTAPSQSAKSEARARFDRGLSLFEDGDNAGALAEFKRAYELIPNPVVLFNIGLTYAAMNRPAEAADALQTLMKDPGALSPDHLAKAKQTLAEQTARVAEIDVKSSVPASIEVDNIAAAKTPLTAPLRVAGGSHLVGAVAPGYSPQRKEVTVEGGGKTAVSFELTPMEGTLAHITVKSHLPAADVFVDNELAGRTPLATSLTVPPGTRKIELRRKGYQTARQELTLGDGASGEISLDPEEDKAALAEVGGELRLTISEPEALVTIDGKSRGVYAGMIRVPEGVHHLLVERGGFRPLERDVTVVKGSAAPVAVTLEPTPETRQIYVNHASSTRTWSWIEIIGGAAIAAGSAGYIALNAKSKDDAQAELDAKVAQRANKVGICDTAGGGDADQCNKQVEDANSRLNSAKSRTTLGFVGAGVGVAVATVGVVWLFTGDDPHKYDRKPAGGESIARSLRPTVSFGSHAQMLSVSGSF
jgi:hypothetical protein